MSLGFLLERLGMRQLWTEGISGQIQTETLPWRRAC